MSVFLQFPTDPRDPASAALQRRRFHDFVAGAGDLHTDRVVIWEPNAALAQGLASLWSDWPAVEIRQSAVSAERVTTATFFHAVDDAPDHAFMGPNEAAVRRRFPNSELHTQKVENSSLAHLLGEFDEDGPIHLLALSAGMHAVEEVLAADEKANIRAVAIAASDVTPARLSPADAETAARRGFIRAGRPWGEAGEALLIRRVGGSRERAQASLAEIRARLGSNAVRMRDGWLGPARRHGLATQVRARVSREIRPQDILDPKAGHALRPLARATVEAALEHAVVSPPTSWQAREPLGVDPWSLAHECHDRHGVWPISFSYPGPLLPVRGDPGELISPITPGLPYSFVDQSQYLNTYADAYWGVTHRKAGWDCFRHVEIMASGALPWMLDAGEIPRYSMVHYPKSAMAAAAEAMSTRGRVPDPDTRRAFRSHFTSHLTSAAMARYLLTAAGLDGARSVLFVDERLPDHADYQSMLTLIGLKQILGPACHVLYPVDYIYDDTRVDVSALYGRGFGYTRVVPGHARSETEFAGGSDGADPFDAVVIGSVTRNEAQAQAWLRRIPAARTVWIHGEDLPPSADEVAQYRRSRVHVFVRAIHVNR